MQIANALFRITNFGFTHDRGIFLRLFDEFLQLGLLRKNFPLARRKFFLQGIHRRLGLRRAIHQEGHVDDADLEFLGRSRQRGREKEQRERSQLTQLKSYTIHKLSNP